MNKYPHGTYLCFGPERPPFVVILSIGEASQWSQTQALKACRRNPEALQQAREQTFGKGVESSLPAWSSDCMETIALGYEGPHQVTVRGLAAALALGQPIGNGRDYSERNDLDGGVPAVPKPEPKKPMPGGVAKPLDFYAEVNA